MINIYGTPPCAVVAVHGGPGAHGSLGAFARELSRRSGLCVAEPWQSAHSVSALVGELAEQVESLSPPDPPALIGHSWGAWLCLLFAAEHPRLCGKVVLVGAPPIDSAYVPQIGERRFQNLGGTDRERFASLASRANGEGDPLSDAELAELGALAERADGVDLLPARLRTQRRIPWFGRRLPRFGRAENSSAGFRACAVPSFSCRGSGIRTRWKGLFSRLRKFASPFALI